MAAGDGSCIMTSSPPYQSHPAYVLLWLWVVLPAHGRALCPLCGSQNPSRSCMSVFKGSLLFPDQSCEDQRDTTLFGLECRWFMEKAEPSLDLPTGYTHLSLTHPVIMPAPIDKTIPLLPPTLTVDFRLSFFITGILILVFPPPLIWLSSVVFLCCAITQNQKLAPAATAFSLGKTRTNMKVICWENGIAGRKSAQQQKEAEGQACDWFGSVYWLVSVQTNYH